MAVSAVEQSRVFYLSDELLADARRHTCARVRVFATSTLFSSSSPVVGCVAMAAPAMSNIASGRVSMELPRVDGSIATTVGVNSGPVIHSIHNYGLKELRQRWLQAMAKLKMVAIAPYEKIF